MVDGDGVHQIFTLVPLIRRDAVNECAWIYLTAMSC